MVAVSAPGISRAPRVVQVGIVGVLHHEGEAVLLHKKRDAVHLGSEKHLTLPLTKVLREQYACSDAYGVALVARLQRADKHEYQRE